MYRIGEKFILKVDNQYKTVMLTAIVTEHVAVVQLLDLDTGMVTQLPIGFNKADLNMDDKGRMYLNKGQMSLVVEDPENSLTSVGIGFPEMVIEIDNKGAITDIVSTETIQLFLMSEDGDQARRVFSPGYEDDVRKARQKINEYWEMEIE